MIHNRQAMIVGAAVLASCLTAFAQNNQQTREERQEAISAAVEALGLTNDQVAQIREIRRERPAEDLSPQERRAWRQALNAKSEAVLTDDQKAKVAEMKAAGPETKAFAGAVALGLATRQRPNRAPRAARPDGRPDGEARPAGRQGRGPGRG